MNQDKISFVLQARMGSTRLPKKMVMPFFENKSIFELILSKLNKYFPDIPKYLATSTNTDNDILEDIAIKNNCKVFRGSEDDVLGRFTNLSKENGINKLIRICCDNPFLDMSEMKRLIETVDQFTEIDYLSFKINNLPSIKTHFGFWSEFVKLDALIKVESLTSDVFFHEHVTNFIYENSHLFSVKFIDVNKELHGRQDIRMTIDTKEDFELLSEIYFKIINIFGNEFTINDVLDFLNKNEQYKSKMKKQIELNSK